MNVAIDAVVFLLLVSAAVVGLVTVEQSPPATAGEADAVADALATTTAQVDYSLAPGVRGMAANETTSDAPDIALDSPELDRTAHGSLAGLLARAATTTSGIDSAATVDANATAGPAAVPPLTRTRASFRNGVEDAVRARTGSSVRVDATWQPYPGAPVGGAVGVGPEPPADGVHAATLVVPTGVDSIPASAARDFDSLGAAVAERTVAVLVPAGPARITLRGDDPAAALVRHRYARLETETNASLAEPLATEDTEAANERIAAALAPRFTEDLRARYDAPAAAAEAVSVSSVRIVVRTWSPSPAGPQSPTSEAR
ncbi:DUF7284 family protein [Halobellus limi]|uniref:Uncharacterized protein n=1 Tax=Halobellus limi TaxID=699433 RepID=A0A1H5Z122_9EURY|nr:hypothetical protein [Halobellus limi]QCC48281.1 hypothetical protein DV707_11755 [Halobellus limi]SEG29285.1 hypothetical protein SAMN04488133_1782 [Halobellus limi]